MNQEMPVQQVLKKRRRVTQYIPDYQSANGAVKIFAPEEKKGIETKVLSKYIDKTNSNAFYDMLDAQKTFTNSDVSTNIVTLIDSWNKSALQVENSNQYVNGVYIISKEKSISKNPKYNIYTDVQFLSNIVAYDAAQKQIFPLSSILKLRFWKNRYFKINKEEYKFNVDLSKLSYKDKLAAKYNFLLDAAASVYQAKLLTYPSETLNNSIDTSALAALKALSKLITALNGLLKKNSKYYDIVQEKFNRTKNKDNVKAQIALKKAARRAGLQNAYELVKKVGVGNVEKAVQESAAKGIETMKKIEAQREKAATEGGAAAAKLVSNLVEQEIPNYGQMPMKKQFYQSEEEKVREIENQQKIQEERFGGRTGEIDTSKYNLRPEANQQFGQRIKITKNPDGSYTQNSGENTQQNERTERNESFNEEQGKK